MKNANILKMKKENILKTVIVNHGQQLFTNCCGARFENDDEIYMDVGRCSKCKEMAEVDRGDK